MNRHYSRRNFLSNMLGLGALSCVPGAWSSAIKDKGLSLINLHTGESLETDIGRDTPLQNDELQAVDQVLRDHRSGDVYPIDPNLLLLLVALQNKVAVAGAFHVISAYRSPASNNKLRAAGRGVATRSLHMQGKAIDIRLPGCDLNKLHSAARALRCGGVGIYSTSNFLHVDTGRVRYW